MSSIDWRTLRAEPAGLPDRRLGVPRADLLFSARIGSRTALIHVLVEHQSTPDRMLPLRLLGYVLRIWERCVHEHGPGRSLPVVIPVVVLHGRRRWDRPRDLRHLMDLGELGAQGLTEFVPDFRFVLEDLGRWTPGKPSWWAMTALGRAALCCLQCVAVEVDLALAMRQIAGPLRDLVRDPVGRERLEAIARYILAVRDEDPDAVLRAVRVEIDPGIEEAMKKSAYDQLIEKGLEQGLEQGLERGIERGIEQGERAGRAKLLLRQLEKRFGAVPEEAIARLEHAEIEELDLWAERLLDAGSLEEVFGPNS